MFWREVLFCPQWEDLEWKPSNEAATVGDDAKFLAELQKRVQVGPDVGTCEYVVVAVVIWPAVLDEV